MLSQGRPLAGRKNSKLERLPVPSYVQHSARPLSVVVEGHGSAPSGLMSLRVETGIGESGKLTIGGRLPLAPLATQLEIVGTSIGLGAYPPYLEDAPRIDMPTGTLSALLNVESADAEGVSASPEIAVRGRLQIDDLLTIDRSLARKFLEWESLGIEGLATEQIRPDRVFLVDVEVGAVGEGTIVPEKLLLKAN